MTIVNGKNKEKTTCIAKILLTKMSFQFSTKQNMKYKARFKIMSKIKFPVSCTILFISIALISK